LMFTRISRATLTRLVNAQRAFMKQSGIVKELDLLSSEQHKVETEMGRLDKLEDEYEQLRFEVVFKGVYQSHIPIAHFKHNYPQVWSIVYSRRVKRLEDEYWKAEEDCETAIVDRILQQYIRGLYTFDELRFQLIHYVDKPLWAARRVTAELLRNCRDLKSRTKR
jgi:hypothetical protein